MADKKKEPEKQTLTMRALKFSQKVAGGTPPIEAAREVNYPNPKKAADALMKSEGVRREIVVQMDNFGITDEFFAQHLKELVVAEVVDKDGNARTDFNAKAKGLSMIKEIKGYDPPKKIETTIVTFEERLLTIAGVENLSDEELDAIEAEYTELTPIGE